MTAHEMAYYIGKKGHISLGEVGNIPVEVWVVDVKESWGTLRFLVRPVAGFGRQWVESITFPKHAK